MKIPYALVAAVDVEKRHAQMLEAIKRGLPRMTQRPIDDHALITIACYGPSLADTWQTMTRPILTVSGALHFLHERGIVADYHVDMDPRPHKVKHIEPPVNGVHYLMASVCPPQTWEILKGQKVTMWHALSGRGPGRDTLEWLRTHDPNQLMVTGGSSVGLAALHIGGLLGYRHFEIHGMDGSIRDGKRHAGPHYGHPQGGYTWDAGKVTYQTSRIMSNGIAEMLNMVEHYPIFCVFHGAGLQQALIRERHLENACCADETEKAARIRKAVAHIQPMPTGGVVAAQWQPIIATFQQAWVSELKETFARCERYRAQSDFNTGSISMDAALILRCLTAYLKPKTIVEIGTFIGKSTLAMQADTIYTCDKDNDCFPEHPGIVRYPRQTSTQMLSTLVDQTMKADLFFFDGRIQPQDLPLILRLSHGRTVYAFDDYNGNAKGVANVQRLGPYVPRHELLVPLPPSDSTIALLLPRPV